MKTRFARIRKIKVKNPSIARPSLNSNSDGEDECDESAGLLAAAKHAQIGSNYNTVRDDSSELDGVEIEMRSGVEGTPTQNSIVTIFSMWNTMMGTSLLSMPWAIKQAGFASGIILLLIMAGIMAYTCYRVLNAGRTVVVEVVTDFTDAVRIFLGKIPEGLALVCSLLALLGGAIVYWILMSNFLYHIVMFIYHNIHDDSPSQNNTGNFSYGSGSDINPAFVHVICGNSSESTTGLPESFKTFWNETFTVPLYLIVLLYPLFNFKSPTFFTKFNAFGTLSVIYLLIFVCVKASQWGINLDLNSNHTHHEFYSPNFTWNFPALTGIAALAYFLQNAVMSIVRNQKHPENNTRDLIIAYALVCFTYTFMGAMFYASFPLEKSCVEDNLLNNLASEDTLAFVARMCLFFQMTCVLPLLLYVFRAQLLHFLFGRIWPGKAHVLILNAVVVTICVIFAMFLPNIGHIISFVGAFCGFSYAIAFPCSVYVMICYRDGSLTWIKILIHGFLILLGFINFIAQFIIINQIS